ncbi:MAG: hypothetical protein JWQ98_2016 [Chlorobi bacterium]|nr:hypothetical protein [Chlorobiota bacterium]
MLLTAYSIFLANFLFGVMVKSRVIDSARFRWFHHTLYLLVMAGIAGAVIEAIIAGSWRGLLLAGMGAMLLLMPRFRGRGNGHWIYATCCCVAYSAIVFWP